MRQKFEYQIAEKLMLPEEKRVRSFDKLFQLALILDYRLMNSRKKKL